MSLKKLSAKLFEAMPVGVGPRKLRCDLGAIHGGTDHVEISIQQPDIEAGKVKQLGDLEVSQKGTEVWRLIAARSELN